MVKYKIYKVGDKYFIKVKGWFFYTKQRNMTKQIFPNDLFIWLLNVDYFDSEQECQDYMKRMYGESAKRIRKPVLV